ncbi:unnamed protein product [Adineta ricciae]|uniref:Uncharacterized protein n=1 Tax=Adineta ricciae TaxID=249248 RepID=A0A816A4J5_ADIRI|nr:unnamed protein product [Adineta ricciae]
MGIETSKYASSPSKEITPTASASAASSPIDSFYPYETFTLVWLDGDADSNANKKIQADLRDRFSFYLTFTDNTLFEQWLKTQSERTKIFLVVSGQCGEAVVRNICDLPSIITIYVFCRQVEKHEAWSKSLPKVRAVVSRKAELLQLIRRDEELYNNLEDFRATQIVKDHTQDNAPYLAFELLLEILTSPGYLETARFPAEIFGKLCRDYSEDTDASKRLTEFDKKYDEKSAVELLTANTPFSRFISKALREQDISLLFDFRIFLEHLTGEITANRERLGRGYRIQYMMPQTIENLQANVGKHLVYNGFLRISAERPDLHEYEDHKMDIQTVLIDITADSVADFAPFACLNKFPGLKDNSDILFTCGAIFKIALVKNIERTTWILNLELASGTDLKALYKKKSELNRNKDLLIINNLLQQSNQSTLFCQKLLQNLPDDHPLLSKVKKIACKPDTIPTSPKPQSVVLKNTQFILLGLLKKMTPIATAMFKALHSLMNETIVSYDNPSEIPHSAMSDKILMIFTTNQMNLSTVKKASPSAKFFVLETDEAKVNNYERLGSDEDLMFQMSDELCRCFHLEANEDWREGEEQLSKQKQAIAKKIHEKLKEVYQQFPEPDLDEKRKLSTRFVVFWLQGQREDKNYTKKIKKLFENILSFTSYNDPQDCWEEILTLEQDTHLFIVIDESYSENDIVGIIADPHEKKIYRSTPVQPDAKGKIHDKTSFLLIYDLIERYSELGSEFQSRKDPRNAKDMFTRAQQLCKCLIELDK